MVKFKVDQLVGFKHVPEVKFHIIEITEQTCPNAKQTWYTGRLIFRDKYAGGSIPSKLLQRHHEAELIKWEEKKVSKNDRSPRKNI